jgi:hypothetical protein
MITWGDVLLAFLLGMAIQHLIERLYYSGSDGAN